MNITNLSTIAQRCLKVLLNEGRLQNVEGVDFIEELEQAGLVRIEQTNETIMAVRCINVYPVEMEHVVSFVTPFDTTEALKMFQDHPRFEPNEKYVALYNKDEQCYEIWKHGGN